MRRQKYVCMCHWCGKTAAECRRNPCGDKCDLCRQYVLHVDRDAHISTQHRAHFVASRMGDIEKQARWAEQAGQVLDWATDPYAIEYRALMKEWWAMPGSDDLTEAMLSVSPSRKRTLTAKGTIRTP